MAEKTVTWIPPEQIQRDRIDEAVEGGASGAEVAEIAKAAAQGEYREVVGTEVEDGVERPVHGRLMQWIDDAPGDAEDPAGHFAAYRGKADAYVPTVSKAADEAEAKQVSK